MNNVFVGKQAIREYLDVDRHEFTSLIELPRSLTGIPVRKGRVFLKMMNEAPLNTFKIVPVQRWFEKQREAGKLNARATVVINSSGGAALAAAVCAGAYGVRILVIMPEDAPEDKKNLVRRAMGNNGELMLSREEPGKPTGVQQARQLGKKKDYLVFDQYGDATNWEAHWSVTMHQVFSQLDQADVRAGAIVAALGTTGTIVAAREYCTKHSPETAIVGVVAKKDEPIPAVRTEARLAPDQILFDWRKGVRKVQVARYETYQKTVAALQHGLKVGLSSGAALVGAQRFARETSRKLKGKAIVVISADILDPYLDQLRVILDPKDL